MLTQLSLFPFDPPIDKTAPRPNTTELLPLKDYDLIVVSFSGGKDSLALALHALEMGVPREKLQLWHQAIDGNPDGDEPGLMDWPCTESYCNAVARSLRLRLLFQWKQGGFRGEMLREKSLTQPNFYELQNGNLAASGGQRGKLSTRRQFPQVSADLSVRWCSAYLKIDVAAAAIANDPSLKDARILFLTGERRQESTARSRYAEMEAHRSSCARRRVDQWRAVIDWQESQVWEIIQRWGIVPHPAYSLGWGRVSCLTCIFGLDDQWASARVVAPEVVAEIAAYEHTFGKTIKQGASVLEQADRGTPYPACYDPALVALAMGRTYPRDRIRVSPSEWVLPIGAYKRCGGPT